LWSLQSPHAQNCWHRSNGRKNVDLKWRKVAWLHRKKLSNCVVVKESCVIAQESCVSEQEGCVITQESCVIAQEKLRILQKL
jgi:hypothetical protein